jgi:hypothetical protein
MVFMNPWSQCSRRFDQHFWDRMEDRSLPMDQVKTALRDGKKVVKGPKPPKGQDYEVRWKSWTLEVTRRNCNIVLWTAYLR